MPVEISRAGVFNSGGREITEDLGGMATTEFRPLGGGDFKSGIPLSVSSSATFDVATLSENVA